MGGGVECIFSAFWCLVCRSPLEKKLSLYLLVHVLMDLKHLPEGNGSKRWWPGCVESLVIVLVLLR